MASGSLSEYRRKRRPESTPEPVPAEEPTPAGREGPPTFVIQEHHASSLHWDFRLERDGVLASWALPKGLPVRPDQNRLAVQVEDHPLEYGTFSGTIPQGQYGAGEVSIWDHGTYEVEKWRPREIMVVLHGERAEGRYVLFPTKGRNWMIHRMDPAPADTRPPPATMSPMLAVAGAMPTDDDGWAYEFKWDGMRAIVWVDGGRARVVTRNGNDVTEAFPELHELGASLGHHEVILDGELVVLATGGTPSFARLQHRMQASSAASVRKAAVAHPVSLVLFDLLYLDGHDLTGASYDERRAELEALGIGAAGWAVTPSFTDVPGAEVLRGAVDLGMEGVVAKRRASTYRPGRRSPDWVKVKHQRFQEVVIGGFTQGKGKYRDGFGALLLGVPTSDGSSLEFVGKVGTGFTDDGRRALLADLAPLMRATNPFESGPEPAIARESTWVEPEVVGEVRFGEWTPDGRLRHPVWRGLRPDRTAAGVRREHPGPAGGSR